MSYIIILAGLPAAGKTTFSKYISEELSAPVISKDFIKEILFDSLGFQSRAEKVKLGEASKNIMYGMAEEFMKLGISVILENNFETSAKPQLINLIEKYGYQSITVRFEGDITTIYQRFIERNHSESRHLGHVTNQCYPLKGNIEKIDDITFEQFQDMVVNRGIADFNICGELICVDTTNIETIDYENIVNIIRKRLHVRNNYD